MRKYSFLLLILVLISCAKNKPEKFILGRWEVEYIDAVHPRDVDPQIFEDFKKDLSYFKEITFYEDSVVYFDYLNTDDRLGTYFFEETNFSDYTTIIDMSHFPLKDSTQFQQFSFKNRRYHIEKFTRNKLVLHS